MAAENKTTPPSRVRPDTWRNKQMKKKLAKLRPRIVVNDSYDKHTFRSNQRQVGNRLGVLILLLRRELVSGCGFEAREFEIIDHFHGSKTLKPYKQTIKVKQNDRAREFTITTCDPQLLVQLQTEADTFFTVEPSPVQTIGPTGDITVIQPSTQSMDTKQQIDRCLGQAAIRLVMARNSLREGNIIQYCKDMDTITKYMQEASRITLDVLNSTDKLTLERKGP
jgi:hypothetical protein